MTVLPAEIGRLTELERLTLTGTRVSTLPPEVGQLTNLQSLDLSDTALTTLPPAIGQLTKLEILNLSDTALTTLPPEIGQLTNLQSLNLSDTALTTLPPEIGQLTKLESLNLSDTALTTLPAEIGQLTNLMNLDLNGTRLTTLPPEIGQLRNLEALDLMRTQLRELPREVFQLSYLQVLDLMATRLNELPAEIGQLTNLQDLDLSSTLLTELPPEIGLLTNLERLYLRSTKLTELPAEMGKLRNLLRLHLTGTELTELPTEIGRLTTLETLDLSGMGLTTVPPEIGLLTNLESLDLRHNKLEVLPVELAELPEALILLLEDNPLVEPFPDLINLGVRDLFVYLRSLINAEPLYEAKVLLVGEGNTGKTSLLARLRNEEFVANRLTTHGIELDTLRVPHPTLPGVEIRLNTWDFGGQEVYRITHQFFFSPRALFILAWRPREGQEENAVEGWLRRIRLRVGDDARVMLVATHCDERAPDLDYASLQHRYPRMLCGTYAVDNASGRGVEEVRSALAVEASKLSGMGQMVSTRWVSARDEVTSTPEPQMTYAHYENVCARHGLDGVEAATLVRLLHERGLVIHYGDDDGLRDVVVVQPEWLTKAISYVLADTATREAGGRLEHARLREIWQERASGAVYEAKYNPYFLRLMEKFEVSYRFPDEEKASLVAQLVPHSEPESPWRDGDGDLRQLTLVCKMSDEAPGLVSWLTVRNHRFSVGRYWRNGVFLEHKHYGSRAQFRLLVEDRRLLSLSVLGPSPEYFFHILRDGLEQLFRDRWPGLKFGMLIPCPGIPDAANTCSGMFEFETLERFRQHGRPMVTCTECVRDYSVAQLVTGLGLPQVPLIEMIEANQRELVTRLGRVDSRISQVDSHISQVESVAAEIAGRVRAVLRIVSAEVIDCPRVFTLAPVRVRRGLLGRMTHEALRFTFWCEHADHWHPWEPATYDISRPKGWVTTITPYVRVVVGMLRLVVPVAAAVPGLFLEEHDMKAIEPKLKFMDKVVAAIPEGETSTDRGQLTISATGQLSQAEGAALRMVRMFLFEEDKGRAFGDLRRQRTSDGTFVWICPKHHREYDPGLPQFD